MCKHILNAQVSIRAPCCKKWFDCPDCHDDMYDQGGPDDHELMRTTELVLACKKCKKVFRKNIEEYEEADEYCPHCDNHYVIEAKTPLTEGTLKIEFMFEKGHEGKVFKDDREKERKAVLNHHVEEISDSELDDIDIDAPTNDDCC